MQAFLSKDFAEQALEPSLQDRDTCWLLAYEGETPVGFAKLNFDSLQAATATLGPSCRRFISCRSLPDAAMGERLYAEIQRRAIERGQSILWLDVLKSNLAGQRFYQRQGMAIVGEESLYQRQPIRGHVGDGEKPISHLALWVKEMVSQRCGLSSPMASAIWSRILSSLCTPLCSISGGITMWISINSRGQRGWRNWNNPGSHTPASTEP
ncbi:Protease synthase and sporulation negative regulatory protein PAI 1 [Serratia fonticola]|uniref:Protease synthase and sporulation negative regulatory protein PAI 1 n=1 Tax=Serratia fonticola TaxID=47917 RepID=A0A4U9TNG8_SERFO|nr:Protease synthase and sporulation negative regulatory protein PAI 1 [Serratia fonticola]